LANCVLRGDIAKVFLFFFFTPKDGSDQQLWAGIALYLILKEDVIHILASCSFISPLPLQETEGFVELVEVTTTYSELLRLTTGCSAQGSSDCWSLLVQSAMEMRKSKAKQNKRGARAETCCTLLA